MFGVYGLFLDSTSRLVSAINRIMLAVKGMMESQLLESPVVFFLHCCTRNWGALGRQNSIPNSAGVA